MMYSCALWSEAEGGVRGDLEVGLTPGGLEAAQRRKIYCVPSESEIVRCPIVIALSRTASIDVRAKVVS